MRLKRMLVLPLSLGISLCQWLLLGLIVHIELYFGFQLFKPLLVGDQAGWGFLLLALAVAVIDVAVYMRIPDELLNSRKLAQKLLKIAG